MLYWIGFNKDNLKDCTRADNGINFNKNKYFMNFFAITSELILV